MQKYIAGLMLYLAISPSILAYQQDTGLIVNDEEVDAKAVLDLFLGIGEGLMATFGDLDKCVHDVEGTYANMKAAIEDFRSAFKNKSGKDLKRGLKELAAGLQDLNLALEECGSMDIAKQVAKVIEALSSQTGIVKLIIKEIVHIWVKKHDVTGLFHGMIDSWNEDMYRECGQNVGKLMGIILEAAVPADRVEFLNQALDRRTLAGAEEAGCDVASLTHSVGLYAIADDAASKLSTGLATRDLEATQQGVVALGEFFDALSTGVTGCAMGGLDSVLVNVADAVNEGRFRAVPLLGGFGLRVRLDSTDVTGRMEDLVEAWGMETGFRFGSILTDLVVIANPEATKETTFTDDQVEEL